ncbi:hypothetical protein Y032_0093g2618 [Ancylostoma ceylanicum]|uniref:Uncharacterized protein n=1 Tax=Ancylostoma ceylanicum TaxID=53326 RepID=A0A016TLR6_9BILA|nr:hypothetical protein Y032_0093g2618 [Ancylostoma ceylanicum]
MRRRQGYGSAYVPCVMQVLLCEAYLQAIQVFNDFYTRPVVALRYRVKTRCVSTQTIEGDILWAKINLCEKGIHFCAFFSTVIVSLYTSSLSVAF